LKLNPEVLSKLREEIMLMVNSKNDSKFSNDWISLLGYDDISDLHYCGMVIKESLRIDPPAP
jgi:cytochrome P450